MSSVSCCVESVEDECGAMPCGLSDIRTQSNEQIGPKFDNGEEEIILGEMSYTLHRDTLYNNRRPRRKRIY
jgi:hypothetical protein